MHGPDLRSGKVPGRNGKLGGDSVALLLSEVVDQIQSPAVSFLIQKHTF